MIYFSSCEVAHQYTPSNCCCSHYPLCVSKTSRRILICLHILIRPVYYHFLKHNTDIDPMPHLFWYTINHCLINFCCYTIQEAVAQFSDVTCAHVSLVRIAEEEMGAFLRCGENCNCALATAAAAAWSAVHCRLLHMLRFCQKGLLYCPQVSFGSTSENEIFSTSMMCHFSTACSWLPVSTSYWPCQKISFSFISL